MEQSFMQTFHIYIPLLIIHKYIERKFDIFINKEGLISVIDQRYLSYASVDTESTTLMFTLEKN